MTGDAWWNSLTVNEKVGLYEDYLTSSIDGPLTKEQQAKLDAMLELARLKYEATDRGIPYRTN